MAACHDEAATADGRDAIFLLGGAIDGHRFAKHIAVTNPDVRGRPFVADVLRFAADDAERMNHVVTTHRDATQHIHVTDQSRAVADLCVGSNVAEWTNLDVFTKFRAGIH